MKFMWEHTKTVSDGSDVSSTKMKKLSLGGLWLFGSGVLVLISCIWVSVRGKLQ